MASHGGTGENSGRGGFNITPADVDLRSHGHQSTPVERSRRRQRDLRFEDCYLGNLRARRTQHRPSRPRAGSPACPKSTAGRSRSNRFLFSARRDCRPSRWAANSKSAPTAPIVSWPGGGREHLDTGVGRLAEGIDRSGSAQGRACPDIFHGDDRHRRYRGRGVTKVSREYTRNEYSLEVRSARHGRRPAGQQVSGRIVPMTNQE